MSNENEYVALHVQRRNRTSTYSTRYVTECLSAATPIVFTKFGDGEVQCMQFVTGTNCDGDRYTKTLGKELNSAFVHFCEMANQSKHDRILLGRWHYPSEVAYLARLYLQHALATRSNAGVGEIPFVNYHLIYNDDEFHTSRDLYDMVKAIQCYSYRKVLITNRQNERLRLLFKAYDFIQIANNSWFETSFLDVFRATDQILKENPRALILIAGGLASKVLICKLCKKYPMASFLDIGSGFDILATRRCTRDHKHTYEAECEYYRDLLPEGW